MGLLAGGLGCATDHPRGGAAEHGAATMLLAGRSATHHAAVVSALNRLAQGTYGICVVCQESIPYGRLLAMPETTYCVSCGRVR